MKRETIKKLKYQYLFLAVLLFLLIICGRFAYPLAVYLSNTPLSILVDCQFQKLTGLPCLTCGGTRAFFYILQGEFVQALTHNSGAVFLFLFLLWIIFKSLYLSVTQDSRELLSRFEKIFLLMVIVIFFIHWFFKLFSKIFN